MLQMAEAIHSGASSAFGGEIAANFRCLSCICLFAEDDKETIDLRLKVIRSKFPSATPDIFGAYVACPDLEVSMRLVARNAYSGSIEPTEAFTWLEGVIDVEAKANGVALVVIDTFTSLLAIDANKPEEVQGAYNLLTRLARKYGCTVLITHHLNKQSGQDARARVRGTTGVIDGVRAAYSLTQVSLDESARVLEGAGIQGGDLLRLEILKDNLGLVRAPIWLHREADGYLRDISGKVQGPASLEDALFAIVRGFNESGQVVKKTGAEGLYAQRADDWPKELRSKEKLVIVANGLLASHRLVVDPDTKGLIAVLPDPGTGSGRVPE
jgi:hypothetical protein